MTPKEKAQELVEKFYVETITWGKLLAKKHALIAVDELIDYSKEWGVEEYWEEVKTELEKL